MRRLAWVLILVACFAGGATGAMSTTRFTQKPRPRWLPRIWWAIGMCETGLNWRHHSSSYQGAFGFYSGSWDQFKPAGYPAEAYEATPWQQYQVALRIWRRYGFSGWGCYTGGGYRYWLARA